jgi:hypothetical protein
MSISFRTGTAIGTYILLVIIGTVLLMSPLRLGDLDNMWFIKFIVIFAILFFGVAGVVLVIVSCAAAVSKLASRVCGNECHNALKKYVLENCKCLCGCHYRREDVNETQEV